jgi:hypothetical protein
MPIARLNEKPPVNKDFHKRLMILDLFVSGKPPISAISAVCVYALLTKLSPAKNISISGVPVREYHNKQVLKIELPDCDAETRYTLTVLINELFTTLFAENKGYVCAVTDDSGVGFGGEVADNAVSPLEYKIAGNFSSEAIYIFEDSKLDIGLLIAVERNIDRIFEILTDFLTWHEEAMEQSQNPTEEPSFVPTYEQDDDTAPARKKGLFGAIGRFFRRLWRCCVLAATTSMATG